MTEQDAQTVDFGSTADGPGGAASGNSGGAVHRAGCMEAPAQVPGISREDDPMPVVGPVEED